jgi:hypothetical protein
MTHRVNGLPSPSIYQSRRLEEPHATGHLNSISCRRVRTLCTTSSPPSSQTHRRITLEQHLSSSPHPPHPLLLLRPPQTLQTQLPGVARDAVRAPLGPLRLVPASLRLRHRTDAAPAAVRRTVDLAAADDVAAAAGAEDVIGAAHRRGFHGWMSSLGL